MNDKLRQKMFEYKLDDFLSEFDEDDQERVLQYALDHVLPKLKKSALTQPQAQQASVVNQPFTTEQAAAVPAGLITKERIDRSIAALDTNDGGYQAVAAWLRSLLDADPPAPVLPLSAWQPIETAPKDGSHILLFCQDSTVKIGGGYWFAKKNCWVHGGYMRRLSEPTHWQPLPATPITEPGAGGE